MSSGTAGANRLERGTKIDSAKDSPERRSRSIERLFPLCITAQDNHDYVIRQISQYDVELLKQLFQNYSEATARFFHPHPFTDEKAVDLCIYGSSHAFILVVTTTDEPIIGVGYGFITRGEKAILGIGITDPYQGRGLGGSLMTALMKLAYGLGYPCIYLCVYKDNLRAQSLYKSRGFTIDGETGDGKQYTMKCPVQKGLRYTPGCNVQDSRIDRPNS